MPGHPWLASGGKAGGFRGLEIMDFRPLLRSIPINAGLKRLTIFVFMGLFLIFTPDAYGEKFHVLENQNARILFDNGLEPAAREIAKIYPETRARLESAFGWSLNLRPSILLIRDSTRFHNRGVSPLTVAFAVPKNNLVVIDYSKMARHPFTIENTLKHEMCHLLLHHHIKEDLLPRWLDEGVCQWASDGIADIIIDQKRSLLNRAAHRGVFIPLGSLAHGFPPDNDGLMLAYEESKGFISHIISLYGKEGMLSVLNHMKNNESVEQAFIKALSMPLDDLEQEWHVSLRKEATWLILLSYYLYEILFGLMALVSILAFIKIILKKRAYMAEHPEDSLLS
jgi:hypothetical protein